MLLSKAYPSQYPTLVRVRCASLYSIGISSVLLIVSKQGTVSFPNSYICLLPMLVMHTARTLERGTDLNFASIRRHGLVLMTVQVISILPSLSNLWCLLHPPDPVILAEASHTSSAHIYQCV